MCTCDVSSRYGVRGCGLGRLRIRLLPSSTLFTLTTSTVAPTLQSGSEPLDQLAHIEDSVRRVVTLRRTEPRSKPPKHFHHYSFLSLQALPYQGCTDAPEW